MHTYWVHKDIKCTFYGRDGYDEWWMMWCYRCRCCSIHVLLLWNQRATKFICKTATHIYTHVDRALSIDHFAPPNDVTSGLSGLIFPFPAWLLWSAVVRNISDWCTQKAKLTCGCGINIWVLSPSPSSFSAFCPVMGWKLIFTMLKEENNAVFSVHADPLSPGFVTQYLPFV